MELAKILDESHIDEAAGLLSDYYTRKFLSGQTRAGSRYDSWAGGGDKTDVANRLTADDLVAVSFLGVDVPGRAAIGLLETYADEVSELLAAIPADLDLADCDLSADLGEGSAADQLWHLVRAKSTGRWGVGPTRASKILARKRPRLIPIYDSVVGPLMGLENSGAQWEIWHGVLSNGSTLPERLKVIHERSGLAESLSSLRIMDVVLWMHGMTLGLALEDDAPEVDEEV